MTPGSLSALLSGRLLARNALWNFAGMAGPMIVGLVAIPLLIDGIGKDRFGLLAIIWMGIGYFSLFDMGLGRALTKLVAERLGKDTLGDLDALIWTALCMIVALGAFGGILIGLAAPAIVRDILNVEASLHAEAVAAFRILACGLPAVVGSTALIGVLEAHQRFSTIATIRMPLGVFTFLAPLATAAADPSLTYATAALLGVRLLALAAYFHAAARVRPELKSPQLPHRHHLRPLFSFGGWLTVTNIVGPLMVYFDRFLIGAMISVTAVAYYVTPYEVISRIQLLPQAIMGVLFPALAAAIASDRKRLKALYGRAAQTMVLLVLPLMSAAFLFAPEALQMWVGTDFRQASTPVARWLALGVMMNIIARPALTVLQSAGRPDLAAKLHLAELIPYAALLWILTEMFGIAGTAAAWTVRALVDAVLMNELARRALPDLAAEVTRAHLILGLIAVGFLGATMADDLITRILIFSTILLGSGFFLWSSSRTYRSLPAGVSAGDMLAEIRK